VQLGLFHKDDNLSKKRLRHKGTVSVWEVSRRI
jgi:hypothetical protein